jgi:transcriptional regulator with XRE-family HTH domain
MENSKLQQRVKELRILQGLTQEDLTEKTGLSLRTIQRIESGESVPRGDTLRRLSIALQSTPDDLIEWKIQEDRDVLKILSLSQLGFLAFPILGIIIPLALWILKKEKVKYVDFVGKSILNFQITWNVVLFAIYLIFSVSKLLYLNLFPFYSIIFIVGALYAYNLLMIIRNTIKLKNVNRIKYMPVISFLN